MCGIVGVAGDIVGKQESIFADMLIMDQLRGKDSVGVCSVSGVAEPTILKSLASPLDFVSDPEYKKLINHRVNRVLIGHNRAATVGNVNVKNAHPFHQGKIYGVHNGTLVNQHLLDSPHRFDVDSENIMHHINVKGVDDMYANMYGAAALVWWNHEEGSLSFLRNDQRPLYYAMSEDNKTIYWASEYYILLAAIARNGVKVKKPEAFKENVLYTIHLPFTAGIKPALVMETKEVAPHVPTFQPAGYFYSTKGQTKARYGYPSWLKEGERLTIMLDSKRPSTMPGVVEIIEGWCPKDDRVNILTPSKAESPIDFDVDKDATTLYTGVIDFIYGSWRGGYQEWDVRMKEVERLSVYQARINAEEKGPSINDCALCFVDDKNVCKKCKPMWKTLQGHWTLDKEKHSNCGWCNQPLKVYGSVFESHDKQLVVCADCFEQVLDYSVHEEMAEMNDERVFEMQ